MTSRPTEATSSSFEHHALFYGGDHGFLATVLPFLAEGVDRGEPVLAVVSGRKIGLLRDQLGPRGAAVEFLDMDRAGVNPARLIPVWRSFVDQHAGAPRLRGIGEPIWPERTGAELREAERHEALIDLAFADLPPLSLVCPYDTHRLSQEVLITARGNHSHVRDGAGHVSARGDDHDAFGLDRALPPAPVTARTLSITTAAVLPHVRATIADEAAACGLSASRVDDAVVAVHELVTNTLRHGGADGTLRVWPENGGLVCELEDRGHIEDPLVGRRRPGPDQLGGRGIWIANQLCDLVEIRSRSGSTVVRVHVRNIARSVEDATSDRVFRVDR